jgi:type II pantothenate kinase
MIIGIDVGISTTKIVGINPEGVVVSPIRIKATDPVTSLYGAFGKYLYDNKINLADIEQVMITGVGAAYIDSSIYGLPTQKAEEFIADGLGARYETDLDRMLVVSMGTGTSLVQCDGDDIRHIGGIGLGGGTLTGLSRIMLKTDDIKQVVALAMEGEISNIDVLIGDISPNPLAQPAQDGHGIALRQRPQQRLARGHCPGHHHHGAPDHRFQLHPGLAQFGHQRVCAHWQPHAAAPVQGGVIPAMEKLYNVRFIIPNTQSSAPPSCRAVLQAWVGGSRLCHIVSRHRRPQRHVTVDGCNPCTMKQFFFKVKQWLQGLSFRTGVVVLAMCVPFYILSFAQMGLPERYLSVGAKGVLWVVLFAWPRPASMVASPSWGWRATAG